jgi:hypothetical protein
MNRLSSNITLILSIFFPISWFVFFGAFLMAIWIIDPEDIVSIEANYTRYGYTIFFILFGALIYKVFCKYKRVEYDHEFVYLTNYIKTVKIPYSQIEKISSNKIFGFLNLKIYLKHKGVFGSKIKCISRPHYFADFENRRTMHD